MSDKITIHIFRRDDGQSVGEFRGTDAGDVALTIERLGEALADGEADFVGFTIAPEHCAKAGDIVEARECSARDGDVDLVVIADENADDCIQAAIDAVSEYVEHARAWWDDESTRERVVVRGSFR